MKKYPCPLCGHHFCKKKICKTVTNKYTVNTVKGPEITACGWKKYRELKAKNK